MFTMPPEGEHEPAAIYHRLLKLPEFEHLASWEPSVAFILRDDPESQNQRRIIGTCSMPQAQGRVRRLFEWLMTERIGYMPIFLYTLDGEFWAAATPKQREILMYHEMNHAGIAKDAFGNDKHKRDTGEPVWAIVGHDVEEFIAVASRYGAYTEELQQFQDALSQPATDLEAEA